MITKQLAEEIVKQTMIRLNRNLNVMDTNGMILASGDVERIESIHEGAVQVANTGETLWISKENLADWPGSKPGVNLPIHFQESLVGVIGITGDPEGLKDISTLVQLTTEIMVHQSLITSNIAWSRKLNELIFEELLTGKLLSPLVKERLTLLKLYEKSSYVTLLIEIKQLPSSSQRFIEQLEEQLNSKSVLIGHSQLNEIFILFGRKDDTPIETTLSKLINFLRKIKSVRVGIGISVASIEDTRISYITAKNALQFGRQSGQIIYFEDVELVTLLKNNPQPVIDQFTKRIINGLSEQLQLTLATYFECNKNVSETASLLKIHRHTLSYRLNKIEEITKLDPMKFTDAVKLHLALLLIE